MRISRSLFAYHRLIVFALLAVALLCFSTGCAEEKAENTENTEDTVQVPGPAEGFQPKPVGDDGIIGTALSGAIKVPADWENRAVSDYGEDIVNNSGLVYVVDPSSKTDESDEKGNPLYGTSVKMTYSDGYTDISGDKNLSSYSESGEYSNLESETTRFLGRDASIIRGVRDKDGASLTHVIFAYNDGRVDIVAHSSSSEDILSILSTWREYR